MKKRQGFTARYPLLFVAWIVISNHALCADEVSSTEWQATAERRLKAIYERGDFRAKGFGGTWLDDSSGYTIQERDQDTGRDVVVRYDVASGERHVMDRPRRIAIRRLGVKVPVSWRRDRFHSSSLEQME